MVRTAQVGVNPPAPVVGGFGVRRRAADMVLPVEIAADATAGVKGPLLEWGGGDGWEKP